MALVNINYWSPSLVKETACHVLLPDRQTQKGPYPVFYLLHGLSDDYTAWQRWTSIERYARELPLIIVMPDGHRSFYCDATSGYAHEAAIVKDLIGFMDTHFRTIKSGRGRAIGGLSMGGYGAMKLGLKHSDKFCSVSAHSGVYLHVKERWWERPDNWVPELARIYGTEKACAANDPFALAAKLDPARAPAIWMDCGTEDGLLRDNRELHAHLKKLKIKHDYHEFPGTHNWAYWDEHVQQALAFHRKALGI
ncbi:esterase family protein [bacterium]|nr:esterase family protein [bacterium]